MTTAYVDTSVIVAIAFQEQGSVQIARRLEDCTRWISSNLLEAELRATFAREEQHLDPSTLSGIDWVLPDRSLSPEFAAALRAGYLRGADLWHIATALYVAPKPGDIFFITADHRQREVATSLGFQV
ncbi:MAG: type II toxin-antitoxin system VapC family toxin [Dehalococcoidia bacterium]|nr:type II toxin-antitoxin system VapC family toxin [Dehalococcoidia bacterium]